VQVLISNKVTCYSESLDIIQREVFL